MLRIIIEIDDEITWPILNYQQDRVPIAKCIIQKIRTSIQVNKQMMSLLEDILLKYSKRTYAEGHFVKVLELVLYQKASAKLKYRPFIPPGP